MFEEAGFPAPPPPWPRMGYDEAMLRYGSDKPGPALRAGDRRPRRGGRGHRVPGLRGRARRRRRRARAQRRRARGAARRSSTQLTEHRQALRRRRARVGVRAGGRHAGARRPRSSSPTSERAAIDARAAARSPGDLLLIVADTARTVAATALGELRLELARRFDLDPRGPPRAAVGRRLPDVRVERRTSSAGTRCTTRSPRRPAPSRTRARCARARYDIVLDGSEIGGGSIRINRPEVQQQVFTALGISEEEAAGALRLPARRAALRRAAARRASRSASTAIVAILAGRDSIRDVIAFPKTASGSDPLTGAPAAGRRARSSPSSGIKVHRAAAGLAGSGETPSAKDPASTCRYAGREPDLPAHPHRPRGAVVFLAACMVFLRPKTDVTPPGAGDARRQRQHRRPPRRPASARPSRPPSRAAAATDAASAKSDAGSLAAGSDSTGTQSTTGAATGTATATARRRRPRPPPPRRPSGLPLPVLKALAAAQGPRRCSSGTRKSRRRPARPQGAQEGRPLRRRGLRPRRADHEGLALRAASPAAPTSSSPRPSWSSTASCGRHARRLRRPRRRSTRPSSTRCAPPAASSSTGPPTSRKVNKACAIGRATTRRVPQARPVRRRRTPCARAPDRFDELRVHAEVHPGPGAPRGFRATASSPTPSTMRPAPQHARSAALGRHPSTAKRRRVRALRHVRRGRPPPTKHARRTATSCVYCGRLG